MSENKHIVDEIIKELNSFLINNDKYSKKELETVVSVACRNAYDKYKGKSKGKKNKKNDDEEDKPKKELSPYQLFMKEQMPILKARENEKEDGVEKKKATDLMKEIGELWKLKKAEAE